MNNESSVEPPPATLHAFMQYHLDYSQQVAERHHWLMREVLKWRRIADDLVKGITDGQVYEATQAWMRAVDEQEGR